MARRQTIDQQYLLNQQIQLIYQNQSSEKTLISIQNALDWLLKSQQQIKDISKQINMEQKFYMPIYNALKKLKVQDLHLDISSIISSCEKIYQTLKNSNEALVVKSWFDNIKEFNDENWYVSQNICVVVETIEKKICFEMNIKDTLLDLQEKIQDHFSIPIDQQQLDYAGRSLSEDLKQTISQCHLTDYSTIQLTMNSFNLNANNMSANKSIQRDNSPMKSGLNKKVSFMTSDEKELKIQELKSQLLLAQKKIMDLEKINQSLRQEVEKYHHDQYNMDRNPLKEEEVSSPSNSDQSLNTSPEQTIGRPIVFAKNDFQDVQVLGKGGFGTVYKGTWMGKQYAIKVFKIKGADQGAFNFLYEVSIFSKLISDEEDCEYIVRYAGLSIDHIDDVTFEARIVLEYCPKGELHQHLYNLSLKDHISPQIKLKWCLQIAQGINHMHRNNLIHCDLKPQNIMITQDEDCRIIDFGISKGVETTKMTSKMGISPRWSPYEFVVDQVLGQTIMSKKSDVWMFGCIMFYVFYEMEPWKPHTSEQTRELIQQRKDIFEHTKVQEDKVTLVPPQVKSLLQLILNHNYQNRPDMDEIIEKLKNLKLTY